MGAQQLKTQYGSSRIRDKQQEMVRIARDLVEIACEIIVEKFDEVTMIEMSQTQLPTEQMQQQQAQQIQQQMQNQQMAMEKMQMQAQQDPQIKQMAEQKPEMAQQLMQQGSAAAAVRPGRDQEDPRGAERRAGVAISSSTTASARLCSISRPTQPS